MTETHNTQSFTNDKFPINICCVIHTPSRLALGLGLVMSGLVNIPDFKVIYYTSLFHHKR